MEERRTGIQVISRAADILRTLRDEKNGLSLGQIATKVDLPRSTVQRIVGALVKEELVSISGGRNGIRLGPEIRSMADAAYVDTVALCRPYLEQLSEETGETIDLSRYHRSAMIFVDQVQGRHRLRAVSSVGEVFPLTTTANGLAALSIMSDQDVIEATEAECIVRRIDTSALIQKLNEIRSMGMAYDIDRHTVGISAVGFAFVDRFKVIHAISVPIPSSRYDEAHQKVEAALLSVQDAIVQLHE